MMLRVHYSNNYTSNKDYAGKNYKRWGKKMLGAIHWPDIEQKGHRLASIAH